MLLLLAPLAFADALTLPAQVDLNGDDYPERIQVEGGAVTFMGVELCSKHAVECTLEVLDVEPADPFKELSVCEQDQANLTCRLYTWRDHKLHEIVPPKEHLGGLWSIGFRAGHDGDLAVRGGQTWYERWHFFELSEDGLRLIPRPQPFYDVGVSGVAQRRFPLMAEPWGDEMSTWVKQGASFTVLVESASEQGLVLVRTEHGEVGWSTWEAVIDCNDEGRRGRASNAGLVGVENRPSR